MLHRGVRLEGAVWARRGYSSGSSVFAHPAPMTTTTSPVLFAATKTFSADQMAEISRLRHERPLHWTLRRLAKRFNVSVTSMAHAAPAVKYMRQTQIDAVHARRTSKPSTSAPERKAKLITWWKKQFNDIAQQRQRRSEWRRFASSSLQQIDHELRADIAARDARADAKAEKVKAQRKADRLQTKRR